MTRMNVTLAAAAVVTLGLNVFAAAPASAKKPKLAPAKKGAPAFAKKHAPALSKKHTPALIKKGKPAWPKKSPPTLTKKATPQWNPNLPTFTKIPPGSFKPVPRPTGPKWKHHPHPHGHLHIHKHKVIVPKTVVHVGVHVLVRRRIAAPPVLVSPVAVPDFRSARPLRVIKVLDPATVVVNFPAGPAPVRLLGVETEQTSAEAGTRYLKNLVLGKFVHLAPDTSVASYDEQGVKLAYVFRADDDLFVNRNVIRHGYALAANGFAYEHADAFAAAQYEAQQAHRGIWAMATAGN